MKDMDINKLKESEYSKLIFKPLVGEEYEALKHDIAIREIQQAIEITPEGLIITGNQRFRIAKELGLKTVPVWIRADLEGDEIKEHCIKDNMLRRTLDSVEKAKCLEELEKIYNNRKGGDRNPQIAKKFNMEAVKIKGSQVGQNVPLEKADKQAVGRSRDLAAKDLGMSGRQAERLVKVLDAPLAVQDRVAKKEVPVSTAIKLADKKLAEKVSKKIDFATASKKEYKKAIEEVEPKKKPTPTSAPTPITTTAPTPTQMTDKKLVDKKPELIPIFINPEIYKEFSNILKELDGYLADLAKDKGYDDSFSIDFGLIATKLNSLKTKIFFKYANGKENGK